jgi:hypothetical protein
VCDVQEQLDLTSSQEVERFATFERQVRATQPDQLREWRLGLESVQDLRKPWEHAVLALRVELPDGEAVRAPVEHTEERSIPYAVKRHLARDAKQFRRLWRRHCTLEQIASRLEELKQRPESTQRLIGRRGDRFPGRRVDLTVATSSLVSDDVRKLAAERSEARGTG